MKQSTSSYTSLPIPKILHELFGKRTTKVELTIVLISCIVISSFLLIHTYSEWSDLTVWKKILLLLLTVDITGGVVANITKATNEYYQASQKARLVFLAIHVQPLLLGWLFGNFILCVTVWVVTTVTALFITNLSGKGVQRTAGMAVALTGVCFLIVLPDIHLILNSLLALYILKLAFSFAVNHD
ncbi:MAG: hypothetical protein ACTH14_00255 [Jeotgalicoccus sp.]